jgi:hypothetical protein
MLRKPERSIRTEVLLNPFCAVGFVALLVDLEPASAFRVELVAAGRATVREVADDWAGVVRPLHSRGLVLRLRGKSEAKTAYPAEVLASPVELESVARVNRGGFTSDEAATVTAVHGGGGSAVDGIGARDLTDGRSGFVSLTARPSTGIRLAVDAELVDEAVGRYVRGQEQREEQVR